MDKDKIQSILEKLEDRIEMIDKGNDVLAAKTAHIFKRLIEIEKKIKKAKL